MKKRIWIAAIALVLVAVISVGAVLLTQQREGSKGILYRVTGGEGTAYLLGSIHIGTDAMYPFGDAITDAMASSDTFVFESDTSSSESVGQLTARMSLPSDVTLRSILGDDLMDETIEAYKKIGVSSGAINTQQPWVVISTLAVYSTANEMGIMDVQKAITLGVDNNVEEYATAHQKQFAYLETIDEFADSMESFSDGLTRYLIEDEINWILRRDSIAEANTLKQWPDYWHTGDAENFWVSYQQSIESADRELYGEYEDKLIAQRNVLMADRLDAMIQNGGTYFVTVGLLHLIYDGNNIPDLLREKGYTVERILD